LSAILLVAACQQKGKIAGETPREKTVEIDIQETVAAGFAAHAEGYRATTPRRHDLLHTKLEVGFDWQRSRLNGKATLRLKPYFYATDSLTLDAKGFDILQVALLEKGTPKPLKYRYDRLQLHIALGRTFTRNEEYEIFIEYVAKPDELDFAGSEAIQGAKGLYFINPRGEEGDKPRQIWTQGETESSSCWFPTIDKSNERTTQEIYITVENNFKTLSNGLLVSQKQNPDGTRTDYWKMDKPHAPYLFMMAVGEFAVVEDRWNGMPVYYYVEPAYEKYAKEIYNHTPEMLTFFSERVGVPYPWPKMAHVIVRDYVSGAMENTTAIIYGDFCQKDDRELLDEPNDGIVAHETFHHWFGDLVTCESWSNLSLNESFANYSEYLWYEHKYGRDEADRHLQSDLNGYLGEARGSTHPLIHFYYDDKEDMFDAHSYNKGGAILHQLRGILGDEAFFGGLQRYLTEHAYSATEAHQLRLAFEAVSGEDLNWYFDQWYFSPGHPKLDISCSYDAAKQKSLVTIRQTQDLDEAPLFRLPLYVDVYVGDRPVRHRIWVSKAEEVFAFDAATEPTWVNVDADKTLVGEKKDRKSTLQWVAQYRLGKKYLDRYEALDALRGLQEDPAVRKVFEEALSDPFWSLRRMAVNQLKLDAEKDAPIVARLAVMAEKDPKPSVRAAAYDALGKLGVKTFADLAVRALENERPYSVLFAALDYLYLVDEAKALRYAEQLSDLSNNSILVSVSELYAKAGDPKYLTFFDKALLKTTGYSQISVFSNYAKLLAKSDEPARRSGEQKLAGFAANVKGGLSPFGRFGATNALAELRRFCESSGKKAEAAEIGQMIEKIKAEETDPTLLRYYGNF
jgi:aminopeptidase N